jgi:hypothetical protein
MTARTELARARRYLLGEASEEECAVIEQEYLEQEEALDRMAAAEEDLIEDYLSGRLASPDRIRFERTYLAAPNHRVRVEAIRRLTARAADSRSVNPETRTFLSWMRVRHHGPWLALAASALLVTSIALWRFATTGPAVDVAETSPTSSVPASREEPSPQPEPAVRTFAVTLSSVGVRGDTGSTGVVIPPGTDVVIVRFEPEVDGPALDATRASIQTVGGDELWQGSVTGEGDPPRGTVARIDLPAARVPADDYLVTLYGRDRSGVEREWARYFLRVRAR